MSSDIEKSLALSLIKSGVTIASLTFLSRIFGLLRELVIANFFGTNMFADSINTAFKFPNLFRRIFGEGALSAVFVPIYTQKYMISDKKAEKFASEIFSMLLLVLTLLTILFQIFMPFVIKLLAPGFIADTTKFNISVLLCRITMPYMFFISMSALLGGMANSHKHFASFAFIPIILNIAIIISALVGNNDITKSIYIAIGILFGGAMQFAFMLYATKCMGIKYKFAPFTTLSKDSYLFLKNMIPATIGSSVTQINLFLSQAIASLAPGAISILSYSDRIYQFPLSIIGICFGTILLPTLSALYKADKNEEALELQTKALKLSIVLSFACAAGIISISHPIMHVIYERGAFTALDTINTAQTISIFALGLPAFIINKVVTPLFYARLDTTTPLKITLTTIICNIVLNFLLVGTYKHLGIAIGTTIASWFNVVLLLFFCRKNKIKITGVNISYFICKTTCASILMGIAVYFLSELFHSLLYMNNNIIKFMFLLVLVTIACTIYFGLCVIMRITSIKEIKYLFIKQPASA